MKQKSIITRTITTLSLITLAAIASLAAAPTTTRGAVTVFPAVGYEPSHEFEVEVNGQPVRVDEMLQVHTAYFELTGRADIVVRVRDPITTYRISPVSYRVLSAVEEYGRDIRFSLDQPCRLVVYVDSLPRLLIWAEAPETDPPQLGQPGVIDVTTFGAPADGRQSATDAIRRAIEAVPSHGVLYFPPGIYRTGTIRLKSNMTMYVAPGARILASPLRDDFPPIREHDDTRGGYRQFVLLDGVENVTIRGRGVVDGNGYILQSQGSVIFNLRVIESHNINIEGVVFMHSPAWFNHILHSDHVTIRGIKLVANRNIKFGDGIDPDASVHVLIEDNFLLCNDDSVVVKVTGDAGLARDAADVIARRNVLISKASALKVGTEVKEGYAVRQVWFEDNDVLECDRGMSIYIERGGTAEDIHFVNNRFERLFIEGNRRLIHFYIWDRYGVGGRIRRVLIKDCVALVPWPLPSTMEGLDADHGISDVRIENLVIAGRPARDAAAIPLKTNAFVDHLTITAPGSD